MMCFGDALRLLGVGQPVARSGWNGKGMWLEKALGAEAQSATGPRRRLLPLLIMRTAQGDFVLWLASQTDMLAEDWVRVPLDAV